MAANQKQKPLSKSICLLRNNIKAAKRKKNDFYPFNQSRAIAMCEWNFFSSTLKSRPSAHKCHYAEREAYFSYHQKIRRADWTPHFNKTTERQSFNPIRGLRSKVQKVQNFFLLLSFFAPSSLESRWSLKFSRENIF